MGDTSKFSKPMYMVKPQTVSVNNAKSNNTTWDVVLASADVACDNYRAQEKFPSEHN